MRSGFLLIALVFVFGVAGAHPLDGIDVNTLSQGEVSWVYTKLGYMHILPLGLDHILFVLALFFLNSDLKSIVLQATVFTVAHSVTLGLTVYGVFSPPSSVVEPIIALSIMFVAIENLIAQKLHYYRLLLVFGFGLIHGMGFAGVLADLGLPEGKFLNALIFFNVGVEIGQVSVILLAYILVGRWFSKKPWYKARIAFPVSIFIAIIAFYWTIERIFFGA